jgi:phospholipase C
MLLKGCERVERTLTTSRPATVGPFLAGAWPNSVSRGTLKRVTLMSVLGGILAFVGSGSCNAAAFKHIVIIFQENRTPDNIFGSNPDFEPGVDIQNFGLNSKGQEVTFTPVALDACYDNGHHHSDFEAMLNFGADREKPHAPPGCTLPANPEFKYIDNSTGVVQPYFDIATNYGFANRMFQTNQGPSFPAHQFIFGGTSAPSTESALFASENTRFLTKKAGCLGPPGQRVSLIDGFGDEKSNKPIYPCYEHPALSDLLDSAQISWRYYAPTPGSIWTAPDAIDHICQPEKVDGKLKCTGPDWTPKTGSVVPDDPARVLTDIKHCSLRAVSWVIPTAAESDHSGTNDGKGPDWVASIVNAVGLQPSCSGESYWSDTAIFIAWDDWGGWADHVKPFAVNLQQVGGSGAWGDGYTYGFRVPLMVVSAYTPARSVTNNVYDFGSILYFIEQNFGLGFIGPGDSIYSQYADYHSTLTGRGFLARDFFTLGSPRSFTKIKTHLTERDFIDAPKSSLPPDDD